MAAILSHLRALECPFAKVQHPQAEALQVYGRTWAQRVGLVRTATELERFDAAFYWRLIAEAYPTAPWDILTIAHDWSCWGFYLDDFDDASTAATQPAALRQLFAQILATLRDAPLPDDPPLFLYVLKDIWQRMRLHSSDEWRSRFIRTLAESLSAYQWEAENRINHRVPSVVEYMDYRRKTGGWRTLVLLVDLALGQTLPERIYSNPALQYRLDTANNIICWANDLFSFEKEYAIGDIHNLVCVTQANHHCTIDAATQMIVGWHNQQVHLWQHLMKQKPHWSWRPRESRHVQAYLAFSEHYMYANHIWSQTSGRYHDSNTSLQFRRKAGTA